MSLYYGVAAGDRLVDVSDSFRLVAAVASGETVGLGAAVSIFRSQATSNAAPTKVQMSRMQRMISSLETGLPLEQAPARPNYFATVAMRCNRYGATPPNTQPLLGREYDTLEQAVQGHEMAVMVFGGRPTQHRGS
jgi:hypothetical protein